MTIYTVSQLNRYVGLQLKSDRNLRGILIRGEISNFTLHHRSGHCYFTLRDGECAVKAVMFASYAQSMRFTPEDGMCVLAMASVSLYERDGAFQLYVTDMQPDGVGAAYLALTQLKEKLSALGYFDEAHKRPLPPLPKRIGVVTSGTGAALQDVIHVLGRRYPIGTLQIFPAMVQGEQAPRSIAEAIASAGVSGCDVLIVGRGGGSKEDLSAFNTELVARAVYECPVPVISAVGHETDYTLADFTADLRAPTPSAAAELAAPDLETLHASVDRLTAAAAAALRQRFNAQEARLDALCAALQTHAVANRVALWTERHAALDSRLQSAMRGRLTEREHALQNTMASLDSLSPMRVLMRGYALLYDGDTVVSSAARVRAGDAVRIRLHDGEVEAVITKQATQINPGNGAEYGV